MRKKLFPFITILTLALFLGACNSEDVMPEIGSETNPELTERTISFTASMPGEDDPATRVSAAEEADRGITLTWDENDKLDLLFVQGENKFHESTTVTNIENGGKNATFTVPLPDGITDGTPYNLYGVYGGGAVSTTNPALIGLPAIEEEALNEENVGKKVMLRFAKENLNLNDAVGAVNFEHVGFLFTTKIKVTAGSVNDITSVQLVGADAGNETWAYNASANHLDMEAATFTAEGTRGNTVNFQNSEKDATNNILTVRNWLPGAQTEFPTLKLRVNETATAETKPARTPEVGKAYYLYATWNGTDLVFADKDFNVPVVPGDGTKEKPYSVAEAMVIQDKSNAWVRGYIVGYKISSTKVDFDLSQTSDNIKYNLAIADSKDEQELSNILGVQLPAGDVRTALNLNDNPTLLKAEVLLYGSLENYFGTDPGLKDVTDYTIPPAGPFFEADKETVVFGSSLELTETIAISTNDTQAWTATSDEAWLTVTPASGTGSGDVTITATENTDTAAGRTATITLTPTDNAELTPIVVTVTQAAFEATIVVDPASLTFAKEGGNKDITVTANVEWTATVTGGDGWLTIAPTAGKVTATAAENTLDNERTATITITGGGIDKTVAVTQAAEGSGDLLFPGSDFNDWATFTGALNGNVVFGEKSTDGGIGGSGAMHLEGQHTKNDHVFTAVVPEGFSAAGRTMIHFWVKGSAAKSLSLNVYTGSSYKPYNLGSATADVVLEPVGSNQYVGTIDTGGEWIKVSLDISTLALSSTPGQNLFALKIGKDADYDLYVDDITIE